MSKKRGKGWWGERQRHSEAAKKGWLKRYAKLPRYSYTELKKKHESRPKRARKLDERTKAKVILDPDDPRVAYWVKNPGKYDVKTIDYIPPLRQEIDNRIYRVIRKNGVKSESLTKKLYAVLFNRLLLYRQQHNKQLPPEQEIQKWFNEFRQLQKWIYTDKYKYHEYVRGELAKVWRETRPGVFKVIDSSDYRIEVTKDFIKADSPKIGTSISVPRLTVSELKELGIEPNPNRWVAPPLGYKKTRRR